MNSSITIARDNDGVVTITLNRPKKHNAFDQEMISSLTTAFKKIDNDATVRVLILAASGPTFSAGADLSWMKKMGNCHYEDNLRDAEALAEMLHRLNSLPIPTIARIQGPALGGAVGLICACDIAIATKDTSFSFSEAKIGLIPAVISPYVIEAIGSRYARYHFVTADTLSAQQARQIGLIHEVVVSNELDSTISTITQRLLKNSPDAMAAAKALIRDISHQPINATIRQKTCQHLAKARLSEQGREGISAFLEKRQPNWAEKP